MKIVICALGILFSSGNLVQETRGNDSDPLNVFILAGQSNMAGADSVSLQFRLDARVRATLFTSTALSTDSSFLAWGPLRRQIVKGQLVHGPEIGLAQSLQRAGYRRLAMIKVHANFGRDEKTWPWRPDGRLFKQWMAFVNDRLQELRDQGHSVRVRGFIWHQGMDDAIHRGLASEYSENLHLLIQALRNTLDADSAPFILARSVDSRLAQSGVDSGKFSPMRQVRQSQVQTAQDLPRVAWIDVDDLPNVNSHHFSADSQRIIGRRFARAFLEFESRPIPVAHRGLLRHAPENTLPAFAACLELGFGIELDVRTTRDGHLVVIHDDSIQRTTNGSPRSVRDMKLVDLKRLDAGSWFGPEFAGVEIPTLEETLALIRNRKRDRTIVALNLKDVPADRATDLVDLVDRYHLLDEAFAFDQSEAMSRRLKSLNPAFRIGRNVNRERMQQEIERGLVDCFLLTFRPDPLEVEKLRCSGKQVLFNYAGEKQRDRTAWQKAAEAGVSGILTDYPQQCREACRNPESRSHLPVAFNPTGTWVETPRGVPVIDRGRPGAWDHMAVDNPYVHVEDGRFYCFYEAQDKPFDAGGKEAFGLAISDDGRTWTKLQGNPILKPGEAAAWDNLVAKLPVGVIRRNDHYHLFYSGRDSVTKQIGMATAERLTGPWRKSPLNPILKSRMGEWDRVLSTHPAPIFEMDGRYHLLFRGMERRYASQAVGLAISSDLMHWERAVEVPVIESRHEIASFAVFRTGRGFTAISQPLDLSNRSYWFSEDLRKWRQGSEVRFEASTQAETLSNPFLSDGRWTVLYEQRDRIYRAVLHPVEDAIP